MWRTSLVISLASFNYQADHVAFHVCASMDDLLVNFRNLEKIVRERFGKAVARGVGELNIKRATHSPISGLIDNAVIEVSLSLSGMSDNAILEFQGDVNWQSVA